MACRGSAAAERQARMKQEELARKHKKDYQKAMEEASKQAEKQGELIKKLRFGKYTFEEEDAAVALPKDGAEGECSGPACWARLWLRRMSDSGALLAHGPVPGAVARPARGGGRGRAERCPSSAAILDAEPCYVARIVTEI